MGDILTFEDDDRPIEYGNDYRGVIVALESGIRVLDYQPDCEAFWSDNNILEEDGFYLGLRCGEEVVDGGIYLVKFTPKTHISYEGEYDFWVDVDVIKQLHLIDFRRLYD